MNKVKKAQQVDTLHQRVLAQLVGFPDPTTELMFHPKRKWRLDFAWPTHMIAVEIHGGVHSGGHHVSADGFINDRHKMNEAVLMGWHVIEVTTDDVRNGNLEEWLTQAFERWGSLNVEGAQCD